MRTSLKWLSVKNFRGFVEPARIEFPESGVISIRGFNLDTGGSSGSGKSSILLAITYALGICPFPATALQSWLTDDSMSVELGLETAEGEVVIARGEKFTVSVNGKLVRGGAKANEEKIQKLLGLPPELLEALTYRKQMSRGIFLSKTNADKQEFLNILLGLEKYEVALEKTQARIRELEPSAKVHAEDIKRCEEEVERRKSLCIEPTLLDETVVQNAVALAVQGVQDWTATRDIQKKKVQSAEEAVQENIRIINEKGAPTIKLFADKLRSLKALTIPEPDRSEEMKLRVSLDQTRRQLAKAIADDRTLQASEQAKAREFQKALDETRKHIASIDEMKARGLTLLTQIESLGKNICPTCSQQWIKAQERKTMLEKEVEQLANTIQELQLEGLPDRVKQLEAVIQAAWKHTAAPEIETLRKTEAGLLHEVSKTETANASLVTIATSEWRQKIAEAEGAYQVAHAQVMAEVAQYRNEAEVGLRVLRNEVGSCVTNLEAAMNQLQAARNEAHAVAVKNAEIRQQAALSVRLLEDATVALAASKARSEGVVRSLAAEKDFALLVGREGFLSRITESVLYEISEEANRILGGIPNTAHVTINFSSENVTQNGKVKKEITPICMIGGHEAPYKSGCSGGMMSSVELAVDLAVAAVVSRRMGTAPGWIILDEAMEGLGATEKENVFSILRSCASDKVILVVDHASEIKEGFSQSIDVEYRNGISSLRNVV